MVSSWKIICTAVCQKGTAQAEVILNKQKITLVLIELHLSVGINQSVTYLRNKSITYFFIKILLQYFESILDCLGLSHYLRKLMFFWMILFHGLCLFLCGLYYETTTVVHDE